MSIEISVIESEKLIVSSLHGRLTDEGLLDAQDYFEGRVSWTDGTAELIDLSEAHLADVTSEAVRELACRFDNFFSSACVARARVALCSPDDLQFGMSRIFEVWANRSAIAEVATFRDRESAERWIM